MTRLEDVKECDKVLFRINWRDEFVERMVTRRTAKRIHVGPYEFTLDGQERGAVSSFYRSEIRAFDQSVLDAQENKRRELLDSAAAWSRLRDACHRVQSRASKATLATDAVNGLASELEAIAERIGVDMEGQ